MLKTIAVTIVIIVQLSFFTVSAQMDIKGKVIDKITREPIELVVVKDLTASKNALTNREGNFTLSNVTAGDSLITSVIGYATQKITIDSSNGMLLIALEKGSINLKEVVLDSRYDNLTTSRTLSRIDMDTHPVKSAQDLLRLVPGLFIAQQVGGGKAEQIFLRGFDADHGTDVNISVDGMLVNMVSQAHGQGWADLHFLIPETVGSYDFGKGPYYTSKGDFTTAGYVSYNTINVLDKNMIKIEGGQFNTGRIVAMINLLNKKARENGQSAYIAGEGLYTDGPFDYAQHFKRFNLMAKFNTQLGDNNKLTAIVSYFNSSWRASGEIPNRAVAEGYIPDRFGVIDSGQGGSTNKFTANIKLISNLGKNFTLENQVYYTHYFFNLFTNFTFYYVDPVNGDEFNQHEVRDLFAYHSTITNQHTIGNAKLISVAGIEIRDDQTHPSWLAHSLNHQILNYLQLGNIDELNSNAYINETLQTGKWLFNGGLRVDYFSFHYNNTAPPADSSAKIYNGVDQTQGKFIACPKFNIQYTLNNKVQLYIKTGKGFHSNDARVVVANEGYQILPAAYGADLGINWKPLPALYINTAIWYLFLQQEFTYGSDFGDESVQPGGRTVRDGIDFSARYQISGSLYANMNLDFARPRSLDDPKGQDYLPTAPTFTSTGGLYYKFKNGINGGISYRYLHDRPANSDYSLIAKGYFLTDLTANYTKPKYEIGISIENLFNTVWYESQVEYISRLKYESAPVDEVSYTAGVPFFAKVKMAIFF